MAIKGAIFDMDGTLTDSMHLWIEIGRRYMESLGYDVTPEQTQAMSRMLLEEMSGYIRTEFGLQKPPEQIIAEINGMVEEGYLYEVPVKPTVLEFLQKLQDRGVPMCVATATDRYLTEACLKRNGLDGFFSAVFTCTEEHCTKRTSDIYDRAREFLGTAPEETWIFEDTYVSLQGAVQSGCKVMAIHDRWSEKRTAQIKELADRYAETMGDIDPDLL